MRAAALAREAQDKLKKANFEKAEREKRDKIRLFQLEKEEKLREEARKANEVGNLKYVLSSCCGFSDDFCVFRKN